MVTHFEEERKHVRFVPNVWRGKGLSGSQQERGRAWVRTRANAGVGVILGNSMKVSKSEQGAWTRA